MNSIETNFCKKSLSPKGRHPEVYAKLPRAEIMEALLDCAWLRLRERFFKAKGKNKLLIHFSESDFVESGLDEEQAQILTSQLEDRLKIHYRRQRRWENRVDTLFQKEWDQLTEELSDFMSSPLPSREQNSPRLNGAMFRKVYLWAYLHSRPGENFSRERKARILGVGDSSLKAVIQGAGIKAEPRFDDVLLDPDQPVGSQLYDIAKSREGFVVYLFSWGEFGHERLSTADDHLKAKVKKWWEQGRKVRAHVQLTSTHIVPAEFPSRPKKRSAPKPGKRPEREPKGWKRSGQEFIHPELKITLKRSEENAVSLLVQALTAGQNSE